MIWNLATVSGLFVLTIDQQTNYQFTTMTVPVMPSGRRFSFTLTRSSSYSTFSRLKILPTTISFFVLIESINGSNPRLAT